MKILDRYILRRFCLTLFFAVAFFVAIFICVDLVGNLARFIDKNVPTLVIIKYYVFLVPFIINTLGLPMAMLLASMFSIGQLAKYNELAALKSAGIALNRILVSVFAAALLVSGLALLFAEKIVPVTNQGKTRIEETYLEQTRKLKTYKNLLVRDARDRRVFIASFNARTQLASRVTVQTHAGNQIVERIDIPSMKWEDEKWILKPGYRRTFRDGVEFAEPFDKEVDEQLTFTPAQLMESQAKPDDMSYEQLKAFIAEVVRNGGDPQKWLVDLNFKLSMPLSSFILVLFGAPLAANKQRSGAVFGLILSALIFLIYFGLMRFVQTLGQLGQISPFAAAWSTNIIFLLLGVGVLAKSNR